MPRAAFSSNRRRFHGVKAGYRSGLEETLAAQLKAAGVPDVYETRVIEYVDPRVHKYTPDFPLPNGIIVESKGRFLGSDRSKHLLIKKQHPTLDIRFVFNSPNARLSKASATTYAQWCEKHGYKYAAKRIPDEWLKEKKPCT
jgi:hypothetical protein